MRELARRLRPQELIDWMAFYEVDSLIQSEINKGKSPQVALAFASAIEEMRD